MKSKINNVSKFIIPKQIQPAKAVFCVCKKFFDWEKINQSNVSDFPTERYRKWRDKTITHILNIIDADFNIFLPSNYPLLVDKVERLDISIILELLEDMRDIWFERPIGTIRRYGWNYVKNNSSLADTEWIINKIEGLLSIPDAELTYYHVFCLIYWHKKLRMVR